MTTLKALLESVQPRDLSGPRAVNRFAYQGDWSLILLMQLHEQDGDYLVILDYHDDIVLLDSSTAPQQARFFQVKTNNGGNWTLTQLISRKKGEKGPLSSHLGKLWGNQVDFSVHAGTCHFVTNGIFAFCKPAFTDALGEHTDCETLPSPDYAKLAKALQKELSLTALPDLKKKLFFVRSPLSLQEHSEHAFGKLTGFIHKRHPTGKFHAKAAYRAFADEVQRRINREGAFATFEALSANKGISRSTFEDMLLTTGSTADLDTAWLRYEGVLAKEGVPFSELEEIAAAWRSYEIERMDVSNEELRTLSGQARKSINAFKTATAKFDLVQLVEGCLPELLGLTTRPTSYQRAILLMEYYHVSQLQTTHSQSETAAP